MVVVVMAVVVAAVATAMVTMMFPSRRMRNNNLSASSTFVQQSAGDMIAAERLVLRLEPRSLDLATALPLLRRHRLHSALLAVRASRGDYVSSVEEVSDKRV